MFPDLRLFHLPGVTSIMLSASLILFSNSFNLSSSLSRLIPSKVVCAISFLSTNCPANCPALNSAFIAPVYCPLVSAPFLKRSNILYLRNLSFSYFSCSCCKRISRYLQTCGFNLGFVNLLAITAMLCLLPFVLYPAFCKASLLLICPQLSTRISINVLCFSVRSFIVLNCFGFCGL